MIKFRKIQEDDLEKIRNWRMKPEVTQHMYTDPKIIYDDQLKWLKKISLDNTCKYWIVNVDNEDVGLVSISKIDNVNKKAEWAYYIAEKSARGKGVGKAIELNILDYVFSELNLNKLCCEVFNDNELVVKIHEKYGSKIEGIRRSHILKKGEYKDVVEMGILKKEWERIKDDFDYTKVVFDE